MDIYKLNKAKNQVVDDGSFEESDSSSNRFNPQSKHIKKRPPIGGFSKSPKLVHSMNPHTDLQFDVLSCSSGANPKENKIKHQANLLRIRKDSH
jgi:hypothetical protein